MRHALLNASLATALALGVGACEPGKKESSQRGYRGTGMVNVYDASRLDATAAGVAAHIPASLPPAAAPSGETPPWRNVQVLTDVSTAEFTRTMLAMSTWVAGTGNCAYCHNVAAMHDDTLPGGKPIYTKIVARNMLRMVRDINGRYADHVKNTGVTCYTCHMGNPVPRNIWTYDGNPNQVERYFLDREGVRVQTPAVHASNANRSSVKQAEWTYGLMIHISSALGVSCSHCHNTRAFESWGEAPPQRVQAYAGSQMVRSLNDAWLVPLNRLLPPSRLGPMGDAPKVQCATCHNGAYKPLYGYPMAKDYPALWGRSDWNGVPFPHASGTPAPNRGVEGGAMPDTSGGAAPDASAAAPSAGAAIDAGAQVEPPADTAVPGRTPVRDPARGAMGGRGPTGRDTLGRAPR